MTSGRLGSWNEGDIPAVVTAYAQRNIDAWNLNSMDDAMAHEWIRSWSAPWKAEPHACWGIAEQSDPRLPVELRTEALLWQPVSGRRSPIGQSLGHEGGSGDPRKMSRADG